jgi:hypothetical protein
VTLPAQALEFANQAFSMLPAFIAIFG